MGDLVVQWRQDDQNLLLTWATKRLRNFAKVDAVSFIQHSLGTTGQLKLNCRLWINPWQRLKNDLSVYWEVASLNRKGIKKQQFADQLAAIAIEGKHWSPLQFSPRTSFYLSQIESVIFAT